MIGALTREGDVDVGQTSRLVKCARRCGLSVTFHRAFDVSRDVLASLDVLCGLGGIDRILTSGGKEAAVYASLYAACTQTSAT